MAEGGENDQEAHNLPEGLWWMIDDPLFIDVKRVSELADIMDKPLGDEEFRTRVQDIVEVEKGIEEDELTSSTSGKVGTSLLQILSSSVQGNISSSRTTTDTEEEETSYDVLRSAPRQLAQLVVQYYENVENRTLINRSLNDSDWIDSEKIREAPPLLVFLDLPDMDEGLNNDDLLPTKLIPMAAEFEDGAVVTLFDELEYKRQKPPDYPRREDLISEVEEESGVIVDKEYSHKVRQEYWDWFEENFDTQASMRAIEEATYDHGRIEWITFKLPIEKGEPPLHLHMEPETNFHTGTFAYNFIRRGFKHGIRMIGTMKSGPGMNVLAVYEK